MPPAQPSQDGSRDAERRAQVGQLCISAEERAQRRGLPRWLWPALGAAAAVAVAAVFLLRGGSKTALPAPMALEKPSAAPAAIAPPAPSRLADILAGGRVEAGRRAEISPGRAGAVGALRVAKGVRVPAGTVLAELDNEVEKAGVEVRRAALDAFQARLAELKEGSRAEDTDAARSEVAAADAVWREARDRAERDLKLSQQGAASEAQAVQSRSSEESARARLAQARARLALTEKGSRQTAIAAAQAELARARAELAQAEASLKATRLFAPADGSILEVRLNPGETFAPGMGPALLVFGDLDHLVVKVDLPESQIARVRVGDPATATVEALAPRTFRARVEEIALEADRQKGTVEVTAALLEQDPLIRPRMSARLAIAPSSKENP